MENIIERIKKEVEEDGTFTIEKYFPSSLLLTFETEGFNVITQITAISDKEAEAVVFADKYKSMNLGKGYGYNKTIFSCKDNIDNIEDWVCDFVYDLNNISDIIKDFDDTLESLTLVDKKALFKIIENKIIEDKIIEDKYGKDIREN